MFVLDIECYPNYFLIAMKDFKKDKLYTFSHQSKFKSKEIKKIREIYNAKKLIVTFNGNRYDIPMIDFALTGANVEELYLLSQKIINDNLATWMIYRKFEQTILNHIDLIDVPPGVRIGLKLYGARLGSKKLQDLPYKFDTDLSKKQIKVIELYCENDLNVTKELYDATLDLTKLREHMSTKYGMDLRSKGDAQIAEAVMVSELDGVQKPPSLGKNYRIKYKAPKYIKYHNKELRAILSNLQKIDFELDGQGSVILPPMDPITIGETTYKMGIGGLHSQESNLAVEGGMRNADYASMYPFIMICNDYYPDHIGKKFIKVFQKIVETRINAKKSGDKLTADSLKIVINSVFGKLGSKYSKLYSPDLMLHTTITGQLTLLMVIERLEEKLNIRVKSANTDGVEYQCSDKKWPKAIKVMDEIDKISGYTMEHESYEALYARDVNNYIAKYDGYVKTKGAYSENGIRKNPVTPICFEAVRQFVNKGIDLESTIRNCDDINQFLSVRRVTGGATWKGKYLGKIVRWYYSKKGEIITYEKNGNKVPMTDGAKPMMDLKDNLPDDLDFDWYIRYAERALGDINPRYAETDEEVYSKAITKAGSIDDLYIQLGYKRTMSKYSAAAIVKMKAYLYT